MTCSSAESAKPAKRHRRAQQAERQPARAERDQNDVAQQRRLVQERKVEAVKTAIYPSLDPLTTGDVCHESARREIYVGDRSFRIGEVDARDRQR